jgi:GNAT superfamily N-acetyltransferase
MPHNSSLPITLRPALQQEFDYCKRLYFTEMKWIIEELHLDRAAQDTGFQQQWNLQQVHIIEIGGAPVGWLHTITQDQELFVAQMFVDRPFQRKGIGTEVMKRLIDEAARLHQTLRLSVAKINPARRLYERLGFRTTHEDDRKFYMQLNPFNEIPLSL